MVGFSGTCGGGEGCNGVDVMPRFGWGEIMAGANERREGGQDQNVMRSRGASEGQVKGVEAARREDVFLLHAHNAALFFIRERAREALKRIPFSRLPIPGRSLPACLSACQVDGSAKSFHPTRYCLSRFVHPLVLPLLSYRVRGLFVHLMTSTVQDTRYQICMVRVFGKLGGKAFENIVN